MNYCMFLVFSPLKEQALGPSNCLFYKEIVQALNAHVLASLRYNFAFAFPEWVLIKLMMMSSFFSKIRTASVVYTNCIYVICLLGITDLILRIAIDEDFAPPPSIIQYHIVISLGHCLASTYCHCFLFFSLDGNVHFYPIHIMLTLIALAIIAEQNRKGTAVRVSDRLFWRNVFSVHIFI